MLEPKKGTLTFRAEGNNVKSSRDYSKKIHWPGNSSSCQKDNSGVTIGRGFDLGDRNETSALIALKQAGIENRKAEAISKGAKKKGCLAYNFVLENRDSIEEITDIQQLKLFEITYNELEKDVERISKLPKNIHDYHPNPNTPPDLAWENIPDKIKNILIDLRYRGDYTPKAREHIQRMAYAGDIEGFGKAISNRSNWIKVPNDRFNRRVEYYEKN
ncbi:pesticin C-terminus-like muramidase [Rosenbergiella nectarea]|uniref:pesticin C-terminus-like muramidase n=1 Tax=Rosenbergiella nectarea TaxID=988801 RepID=UPI001F4D7BCE|nr:pesticin C-terminus-like muramidase [Rosenbergiella nectarea]